MAKTAMTVGAALSLTGRFAVQGEQARRGLALWAEAVNAAGGLTGLIPGDRLAKTPVRLIVRDDTSRTATAAALVAHLLDEARVDVSIGPYSSALTLAAAPVANRRRRVLWNHGGSSDAIVTQGFRYLVNLPSPASRYFVPLLDMVRAAVPDARRVAIVHGVRGTFAPAVAGSAEAHAQALGLRVVLKEPYPVRLDDLPSLVGRVEAARPDVILGVGTTEVELAFARILRERRPQAAVVGLVAASIEHARVVLGPDVDGLFGPSQWEPGIHTRPDLGPTAAEFASAFHARFGVEPDYPAAQAYAAGLIVQHCIEQAGTLGDEALLAAVYSLRLSTLYGDFRLDPATGAQAGHSLLVVQWQDGVRRIVWPSSAAEARPLFA
ncbi:MAG: amino acid ABC transporter substrate-binding protein [Chloroflexi bacterium]|nr:amino acid ABC transporter substrate-binding protein [Chloroflexota bacterium]